MSVTVNLNMAFTKNGISEAFNVNQTATMAIAGYQVQSPTFGTAVSQISTASMSTLGYTFIRSLVTTTQATCTITFGRYEGGSLYPVCKLRPGEPAVLRLAAGNYAAQAADSGYRLLIATFEE
jgi:hypothetical protein